jgi:hypothetical protein
MSLNWDVKNCKDQENTGWDKDDSVLHDTNRLVWGAFCGVHLGSITVKNVDEWIWRVEFLKLVNRPWMADHEYPTVEAIDRHIGLWTNCDTKTRKQWLAFQVKCIGEDAQRIVDKMYTSEERVA